MDFWTFTDKSQTTQRRETPLVNFYIFRWLPKELQLQIWETAAADNDAQIIEIGTEVHSNTEPYVDQYHMGNAYVHQSSACPHKEITSIAAKYIIPSILHACQDAREVALKYYRPVFAREIGGAPIYMARDDRRAPDTFLFNNLTSLQMLRSHTQNFWVMKNDMDFIKSAIVCTNLHKNLRSNPKSLRWIASSLRELDSLWIAQEKPFRPCTCQRHMDAPLIVQCIQCVYGLVIIGERTTLQQRKQILGDKTNSEITKVLKLPDYCFAKYGFRVPEAKVTSVDELKDFATQVAGRRCV